MEEFRSDDLLFVLSKTDDNNEYEFYYKDEQAIETAFYAICQLIKDLKGIEITRNNSENIDK